MINTLIKLSPIYITFLILIIETMFIYFQENNTQFAMTISSFIIGLTMTTLCYHAVIPGIIIFGYCFLMVWLTLFFNLKEGQKSSN